MPSRDELLARDARQRFNEQATKSLQHHRDDLGLNREVAADAAEDLANRKTFRRQRTNAQRDRKKSA